MPSQTLQQIYPLKFRLKFTSLSVLPPPNFFGMGSVKRKYMHTVFYKWLLVTGSLHVRNIKAQLALKSCPTDICTVLRFLYEICSTQTRFNGCRPLWTYIANFKLGLNFPLKIERKVAL
jgi:hypothetical protein